MDRLERHPRPPRPLDASLGTVADLSPSIPVSDAARQ
jgi:hypothetical protein